MKLSIFSPTSAALSVSLSICAFLAPSDALAMSDKDRRTLVGAAIGGIAGSLMSNGDPWATVGGALAGGTVGNVTAKDRDDHLRWERDQRWERERRYHEQRRHHDDRRWDRDRHNRRYRDR